MVTKEKEVEVNFIEFKVFSSYTTIFGSPWIHAMGAVPSTLHQKAKFPTKDVVTVVQANQKVAR